MRKMIIIIAILLLLGLTSVPVSAQGPASYETAVTVTNVSGDPGEITFVFYNPDGSVADDSMVDTIDGLESKFYSTFPVSSGFTGSLVIESNVPLATSSTMWGKNAGGQVMNYASYVGVSGGSDTVFLPLLMDENYGFNTYFSVQNTGSSAIDISIVYSDGFVVPNIEDLEPGAAVIIDNQAEAHSSRKFSATLTTTGEIAVAVVEWADGSFGEQLFAFNGFAQSSGSTSPIIPMVNQNNYGYWTSIPIQNLGDTDTVVELTYTPTKAGTACTESLTIPAGGQAEFGSFAHVFIPQTPGTTCVLGETFVGAAAVTSNSTDQPLIGLMNQSTTLALNYDKAGALATISPDQGTQMVAFPESYQWFGGDNWWSSITIVNVSGGPLSIGDVSCRGVGSAGGTPVDQVWTNPTAIADAEGWITDLYDSAGPLPNGFMGGIICEASGNIVGTLNNLGHNAPPTLDSYTLYEGINVESAP